MANDKPWYTVDEINEEEIVRIQDDDGNIKEVINVEDIVVPLGMIQSGNIPDMRENVKKIREMKCRDDDIFICAYTRSGTHWVWEITNMLTTGKHEYLTLPKEAAMLEFNYPEELDFIPSRRALNTHLPLKMLPKQVKDKKLKIIFVQRNPKDVMVSAFHFFQKAQMSPFEGTFEEFFTLFTKYGIMVSWFDYTLEAAAAVQGTELDIHVIYYEELKKDPVRAIKSLSEFLGTDRDDIFVRTVADSCSFNKMKQASGNVKEMEKFMFEIDLMRAHYRKGEIGDWKNMMTVAQSEQFDELFAEKMEGCSFKFDFS
ncbi:sulfotransferase 1A1-like [Argopecten irradians]|uniref:sulfotransferase 1A1-like n=1 Tax=Argopecten irradians TaxID=31199 RepID=UPI0037241E1A